MIRSLVTASLRLAVAIVAFHAITAGAGMLASGEPGSFVFTAPGYFQDKPVTVYYYKARSAGPDAKVVIAIHGVERSGQLARDTWMELAEKHRLIVLAPEFDEARFPERLFQFGGMSESDSARWPFPLVEHIFEQVRRDDGLRTPSYILFGHSAGAQFVHRFVLSMDRSHVSTAVAANAGTYTMPEYPRSIFAMGFPWSLDERHVDPSLERGQKFFAAAKAEAERLGTPLQWQLVILPGVGHSSKAMSRVAARMLLE